MNYANLFDRFNANAGTELDDKQKAALFRQGLLSFATNSLATKGQGFGGSLAAGLQGGLLSMRDGAQDVENSRYKNEILARTRQGVDRNNKIDALAGQFAKPDGTYDYEGYANAVAQYDPRAAVELRSKMAPAKTAKPQLTQIGDGAGGTIDVLYDGETIRDLQGNVISGG